MSGRPKTRREKAGVTSSVAKQDRLPSLTQRWNVCGGGGDVSVKVTQGVMGHKLPRPTESHALFVLRQAYVNQIYESFYFTLPSFKGNLFPFCWEGKTKCTIETKFTHFSVIQLYYSDLIKNWCTSWEKCTFLVHLFPGPRCACHKTNSTPKTNSW